MCFVYIITGYSTCPMLVTLKVRTPTFSNINDVLLHLQGMACVGRTKQCTIVPSNHYGPIPGIPVGSLWKFRVQVCNPILELNGPGV